MSMKLEQERELCGDSMEGYVPQRMRIFLERNPAGRAFSVYLFGIDKHGEQRQAVTDGCEFQKRMGRDVFRNFPIDEEFAQELMDGLWRAGVRPNDGSSPSDMGRHLEDFRAIVFAQLKVEKPERK